MNSFNQMIKEGVIKRGNKGMTIQLKNLHVRPGFNKRSRTDEVEEHIGGIVQHLEAGGRVPQIEVLPQEGGGVWIVEGHCRREAYTFVDASGEGELWVDIVPFEGDELAALVHIGNSNSQLKLAPMDLANLYQEARDKIAEVKGKPATLEEVAQRFHKTRQHVEQTLKLLTADAETQAMVASGEVSAGIAVKAIREHGADAGAALKESLADAKAQGKSKVTDKTLRGPVLPRSLLDDLYAEVGDWRSMLGVNDARAVEQVLRGELQGDQGIVVPVKRFARLVAILAEAERVKDVQAGNLQQKAQKAKQIEASL